jgi:hypothetical protein
MRKFKYIGFVVLFFWACSPVSKMYVSNVSNISTLEDNSAVFSLPRSVLNISINAVKTTFTPGPYAAFADKYLAIKGVKDKPHEIWTLNEIVIHTTIENDPDFYYSVKFKNDPGAFNEALTALVEKGLIVTPFYMQSNQPLAATLDGSSNEIPFTDLSIKRNLVVEKETAYKRVLRDSIYVQVPFEKEEKKPKSLEMKAEEAANYIIKVRKRKFKMLTGQDDSIDIGPGVQAAIEELNRIENEYISLFIGKTEQTEITKTFEYTPRPNKEQEQTVLFKFSETDGIVDPLNPKGRPVTLEIVNTNNTKIFDRFRPQESIVNIQNTIFYRLPETAKVRVKDGENVLIEGKAMVFQYGAMIESKVSGK